MCEIKELGIIGGNIKKVYVIGFIEIIVGVKFYVNKGGLFWGIFNVMVCVLGIIKINILVFFEIRGDGFCVCLDICMESVKVFGIVDIIVFVVGFMFLGMVYELIKSIKNLNKMLQMGILFIDCLLVIQFDYKVKMFDCENCICVMGFSKIMDVLGKDFLVVILLLQKCWEDVKGNVYVKCIGIMVNYYYYLIDWKNGLKYDIMYGDIMKDLVYKVYMM